MISPSPSLFFTMGLSIAGGAGGFGAGALDPSSTLKLSRLSKSKIPSGGAVGLMEVGITTGAAGLGAAPGGGIIPGGMGGRGAPGAGIVPGAVPAGIGGRGAVPGGGIIPGGMGGRGACPIGGAGGIGFMGGAAGFG